MLEPDALATFGPFFATATHVRPPVAPWQPMSRLITEPAALAARMSQVRTALAASGPASGVEDRVVASVTQLGLTSRLVAPLLGLAVLGGTDPVVDLDDVFWRAELGGPFPLSLPANLLRADPAPSDDAPLHALLEGPVRALVDATLEQAVVSPRVLWGNVTSTVHAAGAMIRDARPDLAARATAVTDSVLAHPLVRDGYDTRHGTFRRRTCCLMYRLAPAATRPRALCVDCVLDP